MSDPRRYGISILENYSNASLHEIALVVAQCIIRTKLNNFVLYNTKKLNVKIDFLITEEYFTWWDVEEELAPAFIDFPDVCFCLSVSDGDEGGEYRVLFFNGKVVTQYPEIYYEEFRPNDFEYQASEKTLLKSSEKNIGTVIDKVCNKIATLMTEEHDPELLGLIRQNLFGDIILENLQDA